MVAALIEAMENVHLGPPATCHWHHAARTARMARTARVGALKFEKNHAQSTLHDRPVSDRRIRIHPIAYSCELAGRLKTLTTTVGVQPLGDSNAPLGHPSHHR